MLSVGEVGELVNSVPRRLLEKGIENGRLEVARRLIAKGVAAEDAAEIAGVDVEVLRDGV